MAHWGALATLVKLMKTARSESVKLGAAEAILSRGRGRPTKRFRSTAAS